MRFKRERCGGFAHGVASALLNAVDAAPKGEQVQAGVDYLPRLQAVAQRG